MLLGSQVRAHEHTHTLDSYYPQRHSETKGFKIKGKLRKDSFKMKSSLKYSPFLNDTFHMWLC